MIKVGIVGGTGYTGVELLRLLAAASARRSAARSRRARRPARRSPTCSRACAAAYDLAFTDPDARELDGCDVVFFATPHGVAMAQARELLEAGVAHHRPRRRFPAAGPGASSRAGTRCRMPARICSPRRSTACPRSIATRSATRASSAIPAAIRPRCSSASCRCSKRAWSTREHLIADCKSGVSRRRAARPNCTLLFAEASDNFKAYGVTGHRHLPGDRAGTGRRRARREVGLIFMPHLTPMIRGIHATLYARLTQRDADLQALFEKRYAERAVRRRDAARSASRTRAACADRTSAASPCIGRRRRRHRGRPRRSRTTWSRAPPGRRCRT